MTVTSAAAPGRKPTVAGVQLAVTQFAPKDLPETPFAQSVTCQLTLMLPIAIHARADLSFPRSPSEAFRRRLSLIVRRRKEALAERETGAHQIAWAIGE